MIEPMKAVLSGEPFSDPDWIFERKLDGIRAIAIKDGSGVSLVSRTARRMNDQFPEVVRALEEEPADDFIVDGELVAFENGVTSFARLQQRAREHVPVFLYVFDLPRYEGEDLRPLPLRERKARLRRGLDFHGPIRFNPHRNGEHGKGQKRPQLTHREHSSLKYAPDGAEPLRHQCGGCGRPSQFALPIPS